MEGGKRTSPSIPESLSRLSGTPLESRSTSSHPLEFPRLSLLSKNSPRPVPSPLLSSSTNHSLRSFVLATVLPFRSSN